MIATGSHARQLLLGFLFLSLHAYSQRQPASQSAAEIVECESSGCAPGQPGSPVWSLAGSQGIGHFGTGDQPLTIEHIDATSIAIRRIDRSGPAAGLVALYMGRISGQSITGAVIYYDHGQTNAPRTGAWNGTLRGSTARLASVARNPEPRFPFTVRECESNRCLQQRGPYQIVWTFPSRDGQGWLGDHPRPMVMEDLTPCFMMVRRVEPVIGMTAFYFGEIDGRRITGGVLYFDRNRQSQPRSDTWFGEVQDTFTPEMAMSPEYGAPSAPNNTASNNTAPTPPPNGNSNSTPYNPGTSTPSGNTAASGYPPPPAGVPAVIGNRHTTISFNGDWESYYTGPAVPIAIRIQHDSTNVQAQLLNDDLTATNTTFFKGQWIPGQTTANVQVLDMGGFTAMTGITNGKYINGVLGAVDFDHLAIQGHQPFQRISLPLYNDIPCSSGNEKHVGGEWAYARAVAAQRKNDMPTAVCWLYNAAVQGHGLAAFYLGYCLHEGQGAAVNLPQALQWARVSADKGNERGAFLLAKLYERGDGTPKNPSEAARWRQRGDDILRQQSEQAKAEQQRQAKELGEVLPLAALSLLGAALLADEVTSDHLCDKPSYPMTYAQAQSYNAERSDRLLEKHMHCEDGVEVPNSR